MYSACSLLLILSCWNYGYVHSQGWSAVQDGCLNAHNIETIRDVPTLAKCQLLCEKNDECLSVDYKPRKYSCNLNDADTQTVPVTVSCGGSQYSEKLQPEPEGWTEAKPGCINGYNSKTVPDVPTMKKCQLLCEKSDNCLSVDYKPSRNKCSFNTVDTRTASVTPACGGNQFSEPRRRSVVGGNEEEERKAKEEEERKAKEEEERKAKEEEERKAKEEEERKAKEEEERKAKEEEERKAKEEEERKAKEEEERKAKEEEERKAKEEEERKAKEEEERKALEKKKPGEEARRRRIAEREARRKAREEAKRRRTAEREARRKAREEARMRRIAEREARRKARQEERRRRKAERAARRRGDELWGGRHW